MISDDTSNKLLRLQKRCIICGSTYALHRHHRIFKSEGEAYLQKHLDKMIPIYEETYHRKLGRWNLDDIQNLVIICNVCHEGNGVGVHGGNEILNKKLKNSFTHPITGFNVPFKKINIK